MEDFFDEEYLVNEEIDEVFGGPTSKKVFNSSTTGKFMIAHYVKAFPCLWDKQDAGFRQQPKKDAAWLKLAEKMGITTSEAKQLWKKARDAHRYCLKKPSSSKSGDAAPEDIAEPYENADLRHAMSFMEETASVNQRTTMTLGGNKRPSTSSSSVTNTEIPSSPVYSYLKKIKIKIDDNMCAIEAAHNVSESISNLIERQNNAPQLKYLHTWFHVETLMEKLNEDAAMDLQHEFMFKIYEKIKEQRK